MEMKNTGGSPTSSLTDREESLGGSSVSSRWGRIHVPVIVLSAERRWTPAALRIYCGLCVMAHFGTGKMIESLRAISEIAHVAKATVFGWLPIFMDSGLLRDDGKQARTTVYTLVPYVDTSMILQDARGLVSDPNTVTHRWGKIHPEIIAISASGKWTAEKYRTYLACTTFANRNGEFWAPERRVAVIARNSPSTVHKHIQQFINEGLFIYNGEHGKAHAYVISAYMAPASTPEAAETLGMDAQSGGNADRCASREILQIPRNDTRTRVITADRPPTAATTALTPPKCQKREQYRSVESRSASNPKPASGLNSDAEIAETPTDITDLNSSRSEGTDPPIGPDPVSRTGGERGIDYLSSAAGKGEERNEQMLNRPPTESWLDGNPNGRDADNAHTMHQVESPASSSEPEKCSDPADDGLSSVDPVQREWRQAYAEAQEGAQDETQAIYNTVIQMLIHRSDRCGEAGEAYHDHEDVAKHVALYLDPATGWKLFKKADTEQPRNYLGWIRTMARKRGEWGRRKHTGALSDDERERCHHLKELRALQRYLARNPEDIFCLRRKQEIEAALPHHQQEICG